MTERIDHAAEAKRLASLADNHYGAVEHRNGAIAVSESVEALMIATEAQVHATLALVEQQRTANHIAYVRLLDAQFAEANANPGTFNESSRAAGVDRHEVAQERIREGLGLS